jgi:hypothetical protein
LEASAEVDLRPLNEGVTMAERLWGRGFRLI